ncbi:type 1 glutamine amidotransferase domain-containing protein [Ottowia sp. GY511]|uniref:Type 1 glutamine amidotransferase domain-containing protein n=1 Tax=Ottowia flava TaxID=2675430 RepID=A0ABW4KVC5_9BURK|nr:type 1 glutamine amidotransferase domain-containing protein [Ottowia sp. GY511]TXK33068.1 type 1 glutamine amidotransferase domain-containing protein [Ottowia sp. GY511]
MSEPTSLPLLFVLTSHGLTGRTGKPTGYYLPEVTHPLTVLQAAGIPVEFASIQGGEPPVDGLDLSDPDNARYWSDPAFRAAVRQTTALARVDPARYAGIFFAGGHGAMWDFPSNQAVHHVTRHIYEAGGIVGAVCHGPAALVNVTLSNGRPLVAGRQLAAFTNAEEQAVGLSEVVPFLLADSLIAQGAQHLPAANWTPQVVVNGALITGQNPQSARGVGEALRDAWIQHL